MADAPVAGECDFLLITLLHALAALILHVAGLRYNLELGRSGGACSRVKDNTVSFEANAREVAEAVRNIAAERADEPFNVTGTREGIRLQHHILILRHGNLRHVDHRALREAGGDHAGSRGRIVRAGPEIVIDVLAGHIKRVELQTHRDRVL